MKLTIFLQLAAATLGLCASLFFAKGTVCQTLRGLLKVSGAYYGYNPHILRALIGQWSDYLVGAVLIFLATCLQIASLVVPPDSVACSTNMKAYLVLVAGFLPILAIGYCVSSLWSARSEKRAAAIYEQLTRNEGQNSAP